MTSLLDSMIDSYTPASRVLSEQHDANQINVGSAPTSGLPSDGLRRQIESISSGGWDEAEYGIRREAQIAILQESLAKALEFEATPEGIEQARQEAERTLAAMRQRAISRANLDATNGRVSVMIAGEPAWHGLGTRVADAVNSADAMRLANLEWQVDKRQLHFEHANCFNISDDDFALVRRDTGRRLAHVGPRYQVIQNGDGFSFLDGVLEQFGAKYETAGAIHGGKKIWCMARMPGQAFAINGIDTVEPYVLFTNSHGGEAAWCFPTAIRTVCANTFRTAGIGKKKGICIRHVGDMRSKIAAAQRALGLAVKSTDTFKENAERMAVTPLPARPYFENLLDSMLVLTEADQAVKDGNVLEAMLADADVRQAEKSLERKERQKAASLDDMLTRYEEDRNGVAGMRGTAWAAFNAATEFANHGKVERNQSRNTVARATRRFESIIDGDRDDLMQAAYAMALAV